MSEFNKDYLIENERMLSGETDRNVEQKQTGSDSEGKRVVPNSFIKEDMDGNASVDSADLLIEEILREFSSIRSSKKVEEEELDDEVAKILKSVQESLDLEKERDDASSILAVNGSDEDASLHNTQFTSQQGSNTTIDPLVNDNTQINNTESEPSNENGSTKDTAPSQKVQVVKENDESPIFGDDFAKYFGPAAGLAAEIEINEVDEDIFEEEGKKRSKRIGRKRRSKRHKGHHQQLSYEELDDTKEISTSHDDQDSVKQLKPIDEDESLDVSDPEDNSEDFSDERKKPFRFWKRRNIHENSTEIDTLEEEEEYGGLRERPEEITDQSPSEAAKALIDYMGLIRLRLLAGALFCVVLIYINIAPKVGLFLPKSLTYVRNPYLYLFAGACLLVLIMIMCVKTVATGLRDLIFLKPNMETVVTLSCFMSLIHTVSILLLPKWEGYFPYSAISATSLMFAEYYRYKCQVAHVRTFKTVSAMSRPYIVTYENATYCGEDAVVKYKAAKPQYFVYQTEKQDLARKVWSYAAPLVIVLALVCSLVSTVGKGQPHRFIWSLSGMMAAAAPFSLCLSYNLPFYKAARHLGMMGHSIAGWSAAEELSSVENVIISDTDLFPPGSIVLNGLKIYGGYAVDKVISYSASLIAASGAGTTKPFLDLLHDQASTLQKVVAFKYYENGGIGGEINGESVIAGNASFMLRTGIRLPQDVNLKYAIYIAINHELAGIFAVNYNVNPGIKKALNVLNNNGLNPILAIRDFNITPSMIESKFNISSDTADYPPIEDRLALSNPDRIYTSRPLAAIGREGLAHYAECVVCARNLRKSTRTCIAITLASTVIGMLLMFYLMYTFAPVQATPFNLLLYMAFWLVPNLIAARWVRL
jgi:cation transport ATPase